MSVHFVPPQLANAETRLSNGNDLDAHRQPRRDPTWVGIVAFAFLAIVLLAWHATANDTGLDAASIEALEEGAVIEADRAPDGTILWAKMVDGEIIYFPSATVARS
jgi:hypothetical protein